MSRILGNPGHFFASFSIHFTESTEAEVCMENEILIDGEVCDTEKCEDSTEALLEKYDRNKSQKFDDIAAMQAVICILLAASLFALNLTAPELSAPLFARIKEMSGDKTEVIPNIIDLIIRLWAKL